MNQERKKNDPQLSDVDITTLALKLPRKWWGNDLKRGMISTDFFDKAFAAKHN